MAINFQAPENQAVVQTGPRITVIGVGGAGGNAVNNMIQSSLEGVDFVVANTDAQALGQSLSDHRIQLGAELTNGLGAGSKPEIGHNAAVESIEDIMQQIAGSNMVFITAGMGGGTGTGAAPVIAHAAREAGILTVGVVTKPFQFEGAHRMRMAENGIEEMQKYVDTLIVIPNQNLFRIATENTTFAQAFQMADEVLHSGVRGVTDLMVRPGMINLDFSDIKTVMMEMGKAMMGTGEAEGERRAKDAAEAAISNPLLDDSTMKGAKGVLINITGGMDMSLFEVDEATNRIREEVDANANIIFGTTLDDTMDGLMRVSVVATGIESAEAQAADPQENTAPVQAVSAAPKQQETRPEQPAAMPQQQRAQNVASKILSMQNAAPQQQPRPMQNNQATVAMGHATQTEAVASHHGQATAHAAESIASRIQDRLNAAPQQQPVQQQDRAPFIPPSPMSVQAEEEPVEAVNPFPSTPRPQPQEEKPSLFNRITRSVKPAAAPARQAPQVPDHAAHQARMDISPADHAPISSQSDEDDLLDIPAFLRRQAN